MFRLGPLPLPPVPGRLPFDRPGYRVFQRSYAARLPGPLSCLVALLLFPIGLAIGLVMIVASLFRASAPAPVRRAEPAGAAPGAREQALARLVRVLSMDETFTADDARQAGTLAAGGATVDDLLEDAVRLGWIERRGERLAVTPAGRRAADAIASRG
jgi:hypothetical protein